MRFGLLLPQLGSATSTEVLAAFAREADALGVDSLWVQEHITWPHEPRSGYAGRPGAVMPDAWRDVLDPLATLAFVAAHTQGAWLGTSILVTGYHRPVPLAKTCATIDRFSGGRMALGLGVGWSEDEYALCDTPFAGRGKRADELIEALLAAWGPNPVTYRGEVFEIPTGELSPKPVPRPDGSGIPLVGGFWSSDGRRRCARFCDWWMPAGLGIADAMAGLADINGQATGEFGRAPLRLSYRVFGEPLLPGRAEPLASVQRRPAWTGSAADMLPLLAEAKAAGADEVVLDMNFCPSMTAEDWLAIPAFCAPLVEAAHA
jgi:probable F420-dependent oxidoreductase